MSRHIYPTYLRVSLLVCIALLALSACRTRQAGQDRPTPTKTSAAAGTPIPVHPQSSLTPAQSSPSPSKTVENSFPTLQATPASTHVPLPANLIAQPAGQVNILVLGSDWRAESGYHTATIILATFKSDGSVSLTSFPRDLYVYIPGWHMDRIDAVLAHGGFALVTKTFDYNFGFHPDHYILTNIKGLQSIIDSLGGINVKVAKSFHDARSGYPGGYTVNPGTVHMDGGTALWYIIGSKPGNEFDRLRRTQEVLVGIGEKLFSLNGFAHASELYQEYHAAVDTDLQPNDVLNLVPRLLSIKPGQLSRYTIGTDQVIPWTDPLSHTNYLLPRPEEINKVLQQALGKP